MDLKAIFTGRFFGLTYSLIIAVFAALALEGMPYFPKLQWGIFLGATGLALVGIRDLFQTRHAILRNYPVIGHLRLVVFKPKRVTQANALRGWQRKTHCASGRLLCRVKPSGLRIFIMKPLNHWLKCWPLRA